MSRDEGNVAEVLSALDDDFREAFAAIVAEAKTLGLKGFGGECFAAAVALNRVIFDGKGSPIAALNGPLYEEAGHAVGHAAVSYRDACWDADGRPKGEEEIESWGMLDPEDSDYATIALDNSIAWDEEACHDAGIWEFETEAEFIEALTSPEEVERLESILRTAAAAWLRQRGGPARQPSG